MRKLNSNWSVVFGAVLVACGEQSPELNSEALDTTSELGELDNPVIYGTDDRVDYASGNATELTWGKSLALMVGDGAIGQAGDPRLIVSFPVSQGGIAGICGDEPFFAQFSPVVNPGVPACSAWLVGSDLVATAGHCVHDINTPTLAGATAVCKRHTFVFDFNTTAGITPGAVPAANVYDCSSVLSYAYGEQGDYAVIKLDRPVTSRTPLVFRRGGKAPTTSSFTALSYPSGIPLKISRKGKYFSPSLSLRNNWFFGSDLDVNAGSSGGPVFNATTGTVEGLVSEGPNQTDFVASTFLGFPCLRPRKCTGDVCSNGKRGDFTRTRVLASKVPSLSPRNFAGVSIAMAPTSTPISGDFNGDNISDIFWYAPGAAVDELWTFSKRGTWSVNTSLSLSTTYTGQTVGDFDGDGFQDIFFTRAGSDRALFGKADGLTGLTYETAATNPPLAADFDGDGFSDLVLDSQIWWGTSTRSNLGTAGFTSNINRPAATQYATGDFDGDGFGDIFWINGATGKIWFGSSSRGSFTSVNITAIPSGTPMRGDFDGDGRTDVNFYVAGAGADKIWWAGSTRGSFTSATSTNDGTYTAISGDFDGDGAWDILWNGTTDTSWYGKLK